MFLFFFLHIILPNYVLSMDLFTITPAASASVLGLSPGSQSNIPPKKTRSACTRCHSQKLRCVKQTEKTSCERCLKLKTICRFEPRTLRSSLKSQNRISTSGWGEPPPAAASAPTPNAHTNVIATDISDNDWEFYPNSKTINTEGQG